MGGAKLLAGGRVEPLHDLMPEEQEAPPQVLVLAVLVNVAEDRDRVGLDTPVGELPDKPLGK